MPNYEGAEPYVDPGTEPVDHTENDDPEIPQPGDADYVDPDAEEEVEEVEEESSEETVELPAEAQAAIDFYNYVQTKDGAVDFLIEAGLGLGKSLDELEAFFMGAEAPSSEDDDDDDDGDRVMTFKEFQAAQKAAEERQRAERQADQQRVAAERVRTVAIETVDALRVGDEALTPKQRDVVLNFADTHLTEDTWLDPEEVKKAIAAGFADFTEAMGFTTEGKKVVKRKVVPKGLKGSTGGAAEEGEPQTLQDGFARARKQLRDAGEL